MIDEEDLTKDSFVCEDGQEGYEDDRTHLLEVIENALRALGALWRLAEPLLARNATRNLMGTIRWSYWQVSDGLEHSKEWLHSMPAFASDGTRVWEESPPAVTNEVRTPNDALEGREANTDRVRRSGEERDRLQDGAGADEFELRRQLSIAQWQAQQAIRKAANAKGRRPTRARKRRG